MQLRAGFLDLKWFSHSAHSCIAKKMQKNARNAKMNKMPVCERHCNRMRQNAQFFAGDLVKISPMLQKAWKKHFPPPQKRPSFALILNYSYWSRGGGGTAIRIFFRNCAYFSYLGKFAHFVFLCVFLLIPVKMAVKPWYVYWYINIYIRKLQIISSCSRRSSSSNRHEP